MSYMVQRLGLAVLLFPICISGGCASILGGGGREPVLINSIPSGTHVEIVDGKGTVVHNGVTPMTVTLKRGAGYFKPGVYTVRTTGTASTFRPVGVANAGRRQAQFKGRLNGWYFGNLLFGGLIGMLAVDPATGAMWDLPNDFNVDDPDKKIAAAERAAKKEKHKASRAGARTKA